MTGPSGGGWHDVATRRWRTPTSNGYPRFNPSPPKRTLVHFRPHRMHSTGPMRSIATDGPAWFVCLCWAHWCALPKPVNMPFGVWSRGAKNHVFDGGHTGVIWRIRSIHARQRCGLMSNYFDSLFHFPVCDTICPSNANFLTNDFMLEWHNCGPPDPAFLHSPTNPFLKLRFADSTTVAVNFTAKRWHHRTAWACNTSTYHIKNSVRLSPHTQ